MTLIKGKLYSSVVTKTIVLFCKTNMVTETSVLFCKTKSDISLAVVFTH